MFRTRILLILAGIIISAFLFLLPKVVVDNDNEQVKVTETSDSSQDDHSDHEHSQEAIDYEAINDPKLLEKINNVRELFNASENKEKSITFADSLAILFTSASKLDSVVKYREWIANNFPNEGNLEAAGLAYYDAFGYAIDESKLKLYGEKVKTYLGSVLDKHPERLDLKTKIAMTFVSSPNPMQGIIMLREVINEDPVNEEALFNLGLLSRQSGQLEKAVERFENILLVNPNHVQARFLLGVSLMDLGRNEQAKEQFEIVKRTDSDPAVIATVDSYLEEIN